VFVSARHDEGIGELRRRIEEFFFGHNMRVEVKISAGDGKSIARVRRLLHHATDAYDGDTCVISGTIESVNMGRLEDVGGAEIRYLI